MYLASHDPIYPPIYLAIFLMVVALSSGLPIVPNPVSLSLLVWCIPPPPYTLNARARAVGVPYRPEKFYKFYKLFHVAILKP